MSGKKQGLVLKPGVPEAQALKNRYLFSSVAFVVLVSLVWESSKYPSLCTCRHTLFLFDV